MKNGYIAPKEQWNGRIDGTAKEHLRWHQVVEYIDLEKTHPKSFGISIIGFKSDLGVEKNQGRKGAFFGPDAIRKQLASLPWGFDKLKLFDCGDIECIDNLEQSQEQLAHYISKVLNSGLFPIIIGGGHEVAISSIMGSYNHFKSFPSIINFDAHFDLRDYSEGVSSGTSFSLAADLSKKYNEEFKYLCIGIQQASNTQYLFQKASNINAKWVNYSDMVLEPEKQFVQIDEFINNTDNIHLTICMDVFQASISPGVSAPQPFGLNIEQFFKFFSRVVESKKIKSFDIAEVAPNLDIDNRTSRLAAHIIFSLVDGLFHKQK